MAKKSPTQFGRDMDQKIFPNVPQDPMLRTLKENVFAISVGRWSPTRNPPKQFKIRFTRRNLRQTLTLMIRMSGVFAFVWNTGVFFGSIFPEVLICR